MIYDSNEEPAGAAIYIPLSGRGPLPEGIEPSDAQRAAIVRVAEMRPRWAPRRCYAQLCIDGHDIPLEVVQVVLAELEQRPR